MLGSAATSLFEFMHAFVAAALQLAAPVPVKQTALLWSLT